MIFDLCGIETKVSQYLIDADVTTLFFSRLMENNLKDNTNTRISESRYLDCQGLRCPLPIVKLSKAIKEMSAGETIVVEASDPAFKSDVQAWVKTMGYELLEFKEDSVQTAVIRKK